MYILYHIIIYVNITIWIKMKIFPRFHLCLTGLLYVVLVGVSGWPFLPGVAKLLGIILCKVSVSPHVFLLIVKRKKKFKSYTFFTKPVNLQWGKIYLFISYSTIPVIVQFVTQNFDNLEINTISVFHEQTQDNVHIIQLHQSKWEFFLHYIQEIKWHWAAFLKMI